MRVWITKYALTEGVFDVEGEITSSFPDMCSWKSNGYPCFAHGKDWHKTESEALARAEQMRMNKIASLRKQIQKLDKLVFKPEGKEAR